MSLARAGAAAHYLIAPDGGGRRLTVGDAEVVVVSGSSPVGAALAAVEPGDEVPLGAAGLSWEVLDVT